MQDDEAVLKELSAIKEYREQTISRKFDNSSPKAMTSPCSDYGEFRIDKDRISTRCETWADDNPEETPLS